MVSKLILGGCGTKLRPRERTRVSRLVRVLLDRLWMPVLEKVALVLKRCSSSAGIGSWGDGCRSLANCRVRCRRLCLKRCARRRAGCGACPTDGGLGGEYSLGGVGFVEVRCVQHEGDVCQRVVDGARWLCVEGHLSRVVRLRGRDCQPSGWEG